MYFTRGERFMTKKILTIAIFILFATLSAYSAPASWTQCTKASSWALNAKSRMMNVLSPRMSVDRKLTYINWMKSRGCNTVHVFLSNQGDGEYAGYSIYGPKWDWSTDLGLCNSMRGNILELRKRGFNVVVWLFADDSPRYNALASKDFGKYVKDLKDLGFFNEASIVVAGLELDEYYSYLQTSNLVSQIRKHYKGMVGTHQTSYRYDYAPVANLVFYQIDTGKPISHVISEVKKIKAATRKPVVMFEMERNPSREKCLAAFSAGAYSVGNW